MAKENYPVKDLERDLRTIANELPDKEQRHEMMRQLGYFLLFSEQVQQLPLRTRLSYHKATFMVAKLLTFSGLLGQRVGGFDTDIKGKIQNVFRQLYYENK